MQRLRVKLPFSPRKRKALTLKLAVEEGNTLSSFHTPSQRLSASAGENVRQKVSEFLGRDDISWCSPNMRDASIVREDNGNQKRKTTVQNRYLTMTVMEAYSIFKKKNPDVTVGKTKFFEYRPKHIKLTAETPHTVCFCKVHGNMEGLLRGISDVCPDFPRCGSALLKAYVCQPDSDACMLGSCDICLVPEFSSLIEMEIDANKFVKWRRWEAVAGRPIQTETKMSFHDAVDQVNALLPEYKAHHYMKVQQSSYFRSSRENVQEGQAIIQVDFAENYSQGV